MDRSLIDAAAEAQERFGADELEDYAARLPKRAVDVACSFCDAKPGAPCTVRGTPDPSVATHRSRQKLFAAALCTHARCRFPRCLCRPLWAPGAFLNGS